MEQDYKLFQVVEQEMYYQPIEDGLENITVMSFNIDELSFEDEEQMRDFDEYDEYDHRGIIDQIMYLNGEEFEEDDDFLEKYEHIDSRWSNFESFKTFEESDRYREEELIKPYLKK